MQKDFLSWHKFKNIVNDKNNRVFYHEREVWWCAIGLNIGNEIDGKGDFYTRPVLIIKGFSPEVLLCLPFSTRPKKGKYYSVFELNNIKSTVILSHVRMIDAKRLNKKMGTIGLVDFARIKKQLIRIIE